MSEVKKDETSIEHLVNKLNQAKEYTKSFKNTLVENKETVITKSNTKSKQVSLILLNFMF